MLVAVSGGIDSMVLLHLLHSLKVDVAVAHCNFNLRGSESRTDEDFVRLQATKQGLPFFRKSFDTILIARQLGVSVQEAARHLRYKWFDQLLFDYQYDYYVTGHNFDDRLETFFINAMRGSGVSGLRSIPEKNGNCIRPLLFATRMEIEDYAKKNNISFLEDSSNLKDDYTRNRIRHFLMPVLKTIDPDFKKGMAKTLENMAKTEAFIQVEIHKRQTMYFESDGRDIKLPLRVLDSDENAEFWLYELLKPFGFNADTVKNIISVIRSKSNSGKIFFSNKYELIIDRQQLVIRSKDEVEAEATFLLPHDTIKIEAPFKMQFSRRNLDSGFSLNKDKNVAQIDFAKLKFPLKIRRYKKGDYFFPIGMKGKKLVSDYFTDLKFSLFEKRDTWLLESDSKIVWLIGHRLDDRFKITPRTKQAFICRLI